MTACMYMYMCVYVCVCVINQGGNYSDRINVECGCKQGDPISPYIFILSAEILALLLKKNKKIKGIKLGNLEFLLAQYADDTTVMLDGSESSLNETLRELEFFKKYIRTKG